MAGSTAEHERLADHAARAANWQRFGPYLSERQWGTVREDYSPDGNVWESFPHDHARSRAYRWGEDGLLGFTDRQCRLCFGFAFWNGRDPYLKERLFGLTGPQGNHGEDVKEEYFYVDALPTSAWLVSQYKYPQREFPYQELVDENARRSRDEREFELVDSGVFADGYFDLVATIAKAGPEDVLVELSVSNRADHAAELHVLPQLWFRNTWDWGREGEGYWLRGRIRGAAVDGGADDGGAIARFEAEGADLPPFVLELDRIDGGELRRVLATENETNATRLFDAADDGPKKDAFHEFVVDGKADAVAVDDVGSKAAAHCVLELPAGGVASIRLRLQRRDAANSPAFGPGFGETLARRRREADEFYETVYRGDPDDAEGRRIQRQAAAGLIFTKQFYYYDVASWLAGDPAQPAPPASRAAGRNADFRHLYNRDILSMPDKWEYPWYAAWDLAFHMLPFATLDPQFSKDQLLLLLREWYMAPNGQIPAYEFAFHDVNPPVHAWACWRVYKLTGHRGSRDRVFLARAFHKLLLNFTWWVNRKDLKGKHVFGGGFLGLDNIGVFDRSQPLPTGGHLEQADGTAWMAFYCATMLSMALELACEDPAYEDIATKFFEHFVAISHAINSLGGTGLWDDTDGFYYDQIYRDGDAERLRIRSLVGLIPLCAVEILDLRRVAVLPGFKKRMDWFLEHERELAQRITFGRVEDADAALLSIPSRAQLERVLHYLCDENEFLSPFGIRSLSRAHKDHPFVMQLDGNEYRVDYTPGESTTSMFGGNSNWRGPIWFPLNYLLIEALERYARFYGDSLLVEYPTGSGNRMDLQQVADDLSRRLTTLFRRSSDGQPPFAGNDRRFADDPHYRDLIWFYEFFDGDTGRGCGASHQTGWTALVARLFG
ncbi:MAG: glucosidase [bacterium]|nr:glucosidase [bacterium]